MPNFEENPDFTKEIDKALDAYEKQQGIPIWERMDAPEYLSMNIDVLRKKTADELAEATYALNQYAFNLQRVINKNKAWQRWAISKLDELEAYYLQDVPDRYGFNERPKIARHQPELCKKINEFLRTIDMRLNRLYDFPSQIKAISDSIRELRFAAIRRDKEYNNA